MAALIVGSPAAPAFECARLKITKPPPDKGQPWLRGEMWYTTLVDLTPHRSPLWKRPSSKDQS